MKRVSLRIAVNQENLTAVWATFRLLKGALPPRRMQDSRRFLPFAGRGGFIYRLPWSGGR